MLILAYHRVTPALRGSLSVSAADFRAQLRHLLDDGWVNVPLDGAGSAPDERAFAITFDDGYRDNYLHAMPVLSDLGLTATMFVATGYVGTAAPFPWDAERVRQWGGVIEEDLPVTWAQIDEMRRDDRFAIGSHTVTHPLLSTVPRAAAREEIVRSREVLEQRLGCAVPTFCYPKGDTSPEVISLVEEAGYELGVVTPPRAVPRGRFTLRRVGVYANTSPRAFRFKTGPVFRLMLRTGAWPALRRLRPRRGA